MKHDLLYTLLYAGVLLTAGCASNEVTYSPLTESQQELVDWIDGVPMKNKASSALPEGTDVDFQLPESGRTPLMLAIAAEEPAKVKAILDAKPRLERTDRNGMTALHYAAGLEKTEIAAMLLDAGANVNARSKIGKTPLHEACRMGNLNTVDFLLSKGADIQAKDELARSVTIFAASAPKNATAMLNLLESKGVSIATIDKKASTPLTCAIAAKNTDTAMTILSYFPENIAADPIATFAGLLAMKQAIRSNDFIVVAELIRRKLPLNTDLNMAYTVLKTVSIENWMRTFARAGAIEDGQTPLFWAAQENNVKMIDILLEAGSNPLCFDNTQSRAVDYARTYAAVKRLERAMKETAAKNNIELKKKK